jgi:2-polyprenyl-3-methyl-5-hydroxy-6-metoxy-1,4-benzoquinol methylase
MGLELIHYRLKSDPNGSHQQIARMVRELNVGPILDVGSAQGMLGQLIADTKLPIDAIEPNPTWAEAAKPYYRNVYTGTVESAALPPKTYRAIVCADVLEHTADPAAVLKQLIALGTDDAAFIISLPNVAHLAVRMMLLLGMFPKMERGILDKTHLQFFTRKTAIDMLRDAGLRVERTSATGVPLEELWKSDRPGPLFRAARGTQWMFVRLLPTMFGFQSIFLARPANGSV